MANTIPEWVKEGAEVIETPGLLFRTWGRVLKIGKVRKNGLFTLEGNENLWSPWRDGADPCKSNLGGRSLAPATPENRAKAEKSLRVAEAKERLFKHAEKLEKGARSWDDDVLLAEAAKLPPEEGQHD